MFNSKKARIVAVISFSVAAAIAAASSTFGVFSGVLSPDHYREHTYRVGPGEWQAGAVNELPGDLDIEVYNERGRLIASDTLADNLPIAKFSNPYRQLITVRVINSSTTRAADYTGFVE